MPNSNIKTSGFSLAKAKELKGDDYYSFITMGSLSIAIVRNNLNFSCYRWK